MAWTISRTLYENWNSSQVQAAESSEESCSDMKSSAQLNTTPTPDQYYWPDKTTEHSRLSRFGMTCVPLTENHGEALLTWFRAGFPARTSAPQEKAQESKGREADFGEKWHESLAKFDPDSYSWKTRQCSLLEEWEQSLEIFPRWGLMRGGELFQQPILALHTRGSESGLWPTPIAPEWKNGCGKTGNRSTEKAAKAGLKLSEAVRMWPTPNTHGYRSDGELLMLSRKLETQAEYLAMTDRAANSKRERFWPTPCAGDYRSPNMNPAKSGQKIMPSSEHSLPTKVGGLLNPTWVEWLMGWPLGWTDLKPLETAKFREWLQQHGES